MATETLKVVGFPKPLDLVLLRRFKREVPGLVEATLDANYGLADLGALLPRGTAVVVTPPAPAPAVAPLPLVRLFD